MMTIVTPDGNEAPHIETFRENHDFMRLHGSRLVDNGYRIIPIAPRTKKPAVYEPVDRWINFRDWNTINASKKDVEHWTKWPGAGIGIICSNVCGVDINILDKDLSQAVAASVMTELGVTSAIRIGRQPKRLLVYRTDAPFSKITMSPIECLCQDQQFVAYGIHPDTGSPYEWEIEGLVDIAASSLPTVTSEQVRRALEKALQLVPEAMRPRRSATNSRSILAR
jgi:predicted RNA-binding protein associated with RNAse of E/G family